jgi:hypothetical protein
MGRARYVGVAASRRHPSPLVEAMTGALREAARQVVERTNLLNVTGGRPPTRSMLSVTS